MDTSNWINLIAGILVGGGTLTLAVMTWKSIQQTRNIHKKERRDRLLNEIIEWAINVTNWRSESKKIFKEMAGITDSKQQQVLTHAHIVEVKEGFVGMGGRNQYISSIAEKSQKFYKKL